MFVIVLRRARIAAAILLVLVLLASPYSLVWSRQDGSPDAPPAAGAVSPPGGTSGP
jgi:peptidoglycan/LPS O-acetylase OafA/YrhL